MFRRLLATVFVAAAASATLVAIPSASVADQRPQARVFAGSFSPDGDGVKDVATIQYTVPRTARVVLRIDPVNAVDAPLRVVRLGVVESGTHTWAWDGRDERGGRVADGTSYRVTVSSPDGRWDDGSDQVDVDMGFALFLALDPDSDTAADPTVYPRTTVVRDVIELLVSGDGRDEVAHRLSLTISDRRGAVVLRRVEREVRATSGRFLIHRWNARVDSRVLPAGRYRVVVTGVDPAGNRDRETRRIRVSEQSLELAEVSYDVSPAASLRQVCGWLRTDDACYQEHQPCGAVVPSDVYPGGLSYRSAQCSEYTQDHRATGLHFQPVPEATVRGVHSARVSLVGRPTTGGFDYGRLRLFPEGYRTTGVVGATSATTAWVKFPEGYRSWLTSGGERIPPGVRWTFETNGTDSVDIQQYTVTVRYLVIAD